MKELNCSGNYQPRLVWNKNLLGDVTPQQLINAMAFYIGLFLLYAVELNIGILDFSHHR